MNLSQLISIVSRAAGPLVLAGGLLAQPQLDLGAQDSPALWFLGGQAGPGPGPGFPGALRSGRSFLGVAVVEVTAPRAKDLKLKEERGVEITIVTENSPAAKAGLKTGDVVLEYNGQKVEGTEQFVRLVRETPVGRAVKLLVSRDGATRTFSATTGSRTSEGPFPVPPMDADKFQRQMEQAQREIDKLRDLRMPDIPKPYMSVQTPLLGVEVEQLGPQLSEYFGAKEGVLIRSVLKDSAAERGGLKAGDVILKVGDEKVTNPRDVANAVRSSRSQGTVSITVVRNRKEMTLPVKLADQSREQAPRGRAVSNPGTKL